VKVQRRSNETAAAGRPWSRPFLAATTAATAASCRSKLDVAADHRAEGNKRASVSCLRHRRLDLNRKRLICIDS
jgi:hypothetical protein